MEDNLFGRLIDLSVGTGDKAPLEAVQRIKDLEFALSKIVYCFNADQKMKSKDRTLLRKIALDELRRSEWWG